MRLRNSMFVRTLALFCLAFLLPTVFIQLFYYPRYKGILLDTMRRDSTQAITSIRSSFDKELNDIIKVWNTVNSVEQMELVSGNPGVTSTMKFTSMLKRQFSISYVMTRLYVVTQGEDRVYGDSGTLSFELFVSQMLETTNIDIAANPEMLWNVYKVDVFASGDTPSFFFVFPLGKKQSASKRSLVLVADYGRFLSYGRTPIAPSEGVVGILDSEGRPISPRAVHEAPYDTEL